MWIRSQDKKQLVNANDLYIAVREKRYCISTGKGNDLGKYSIEEKAIKVLDMIDAFKNQPLQIEELQNVYIHNYEKTFQMPQDSEVEE